VVLQARWGALWLAVCATGLLLAAPQPAQAADASYCVTCKNPEQTYLCRVNAGGAKAGDALKLYCVIRTAKEGGHSSCSAERASHGCSGVEKVYSYDGPLPEDLASDPRIKKFTDKIERERKTFDPPQRGNQPKTFVEMTGRAVNASRQGLRNARSRFGGSSEEVHQSLPEPPLTYDQPLPHDQAPAPLAAESAPPPIPEVSQPNRAQRASSAVGGFARKSYRCVASLFRRCSEEEPVADDTLR
jgi:hypothetical protein